MISTSMVSDPASKLHITLVRAPLISRVGAFNKSVPHLGLAYVAGYIRKFGYEVEFLDGQAEALNEVHPLENSPGFQIQGITPAELIGRIPPHTDVIAFTSMFSAEWVFLREIIRLIRARFPGVLLVAGGEHFTALPEHSLRDCPELNLIVKGEGEHTFYEVLEVYGSGGDYHQVAGICYLDANGEFHDNGGLPRIRDVGSIPWPYWPDGYLEKFWAAGKSYGVRTERDMPILGSRGCPYRCTFCSSPQMWTTRYVMRDVDDVIAEIRHYIERYDITSFQFYDLTVFTKKRWTVAFCNKLIEEGINLKSSLPSGTRSEVLDEEVLALLKSGCEYLAYAPESGSPRTLEIIKKQVHLDRMVKSIRAAKRLALTVRTNLIIGFPHERRRDVLQTLWFGLCMAALGVDEVPFFIFSAYPGTEIFQGLLENKVVKLNDAYFMSLVSLTASFPI